MASAFGHAFSAIALGTTFSKSLTNWKFWALGIICSILPDADVIITNPDHFAVALKYTPNEMPAPLLLAKGADLVAEKIKEVAIENKIPIVQAAPLARSIYHFTEINEEIPEGLYMAVAQILAYIFQLSQYQKGHAQKPEDLPGFDIPDDLKFDP